MEVHTVHNNFVFDYCKPNDIQICEFFIKTICENIKRRWMSDNGGNIGSRICIYNSVESINVKGNYVPLEPLLQSLYCTI